MLSIVKDFKRKEIFSFYLDRRFFPRLSSQLDLIYITGRFSALILMLTLKGNQTSITSDRGVDIGKADTRPRFIRLSHISNISHKEIYWKPKRHTGPQSNKFALLHHPSHNSTSICTNSYENKTIESLYWPNFYVKYIFPNYITNLLALLKNYSTFSDVFILQIQKRLSIVLKNIVFIPFSPNG